MLSTTRQYATLALASGGSATATLSLAKGPPRLQSGPHRYLRSVETETLTRSVTHKRPGHRAELVRHVPSSALGSPGSGFRG